MGTNSSLRKGYNSWKISRKRGNSKLKQTTYCPICNLEFKSWQTYDDFNYHLDNCLSGDSFTFHEQAKTCTKLSSLKEKLEWVRKQFNSIRIPWSEEYHKIEVHREIILEDSLRAVQILTDRDMHAEFQISFVGEIAMDAGGLMKEWINVLIKHIFSENMGLFRRTRTDQVAYTLTSVNYQDELYYFTGRLLGKAVFENIPINCPLSKVVFKHLLQEHASFEDIQYLDTDLYNSLVCITGSSIEDVFIGYFALENGSNLYELKKNGSEISITEENKREYIELRTEFELIKSMLPGLNSFKDGFYSVVPHRFISDLKSEDLETLLCGKPHLDLNEWKMNTEYKGDFSSNHKVVKWFWSVLEEFSQEDLASLLVFVTGTSRVPIDGFENLKTLRGDNAKFTLQSIDLSKFSLPKAHTCFNRLELPLYSSKNLLKTALKTVIKHHTFGFGLE